MNKQSGMTLLEVLLAMSIFTAVALTLMSSMQGQRNAIERMRNETLALWIADNQLQSQDLFDEENTSSSGKELINGEMTGMKNFQFIFSHLDLMTATNRRW